MAMLASKSFPTTLGAQPSGMMAATTQTAYQHPTRRAPTAPTTTQNYASPTESEFDNVDGPDSVRNWDEDRVCEYLRSVKCGEYEKMFRKHHINGENLLEIDKEVLKEMGIEKIGDRVRLFLSIKKLRTKTYANQRRRHRVSDSGTFYDSVFFLTNLPGSLCRARCPVRALVVFGPTLRWPCSAADATKQEIFSPI